MGAAFALGVLWVGFGESLLLAVGLFLLLAVAFGMIYVRNSAPRARLTRRISPVQVHDGDRAIVQLSLVSSRRLHSAIVEDVVHSLGTASFVAERVDESKPMTARYEVLCKPRGVYKVGPAIVKVRDPMALAESISSGRRADRLVVYKAAVAILDRALEKSLESRYQKSKQMGDHLRLLGQKLDNLKEQAKEQ